MEHDEKKIKEIYRSEALHVLTAYNPTKMQYVDMSVEVKMAMMKYAEHMVKQERKVIADVVFSEAKNTGQLVHINTVRVLDIINN